MNKLSFDIYEHIRKGFSKEEISKKFKIPIWIIDNVQKNGFIEKLDEEFEKFYDFINRNFIFDVKIISKMTGIKESKVLKFLKMIKRHELFSSDEMEIIFKLYQEKRIDELTEIFNNYIKDHFIHNLRPFKEIDIKNVKDWVLPQKLIIDFYFNPTEETFKNFEFYSKKYKDENKVLTYYLILLYKTSAINNFCSLKEDFIEVREIYYEIYDKVKNILPKILLFELNKQAALSSLKILDKGLFNSVNGWISEDRAYNITFDYDGNYLISGLIIASSNSSYPIVLKVDRENGNLIWARVWNTPPPNTTSNEARGIIPIGQGKFYLLTFLGGFGGFAVIREDTASPIQCTQNINFNVSSLGTSIDNFTLQVYNDTLEGNSFPLSYIYTSAFLTEGCSISSNYEFNKSCLFKVSSNKGYIHIELNKREKVSIYDISGKAIYNEFFEGKRKVKVKEGVYVVRIGKENVKVVVK